MPPRAPCASADDRPRRHAVSYAAEVPSVAPSPAEGTAVVVGGGPGGLMAAQVLAGAGVRVTVVEHRPSVGRKFLLAGRSGLNLTHSEPIDDMLARYGDRRRYVEHAVRAFDASSLRAWAADLGEPTYVGTSGRVFPRSSRATSLLRSWLRRLDELGVEWWTRTIWTGWAADGALRFERGDGEVVTVRPDITVLALGGASWPRTGSDGSWVALLRGVGVEVADLLPANCGVMVDWRDEFVERHAGSPLKNVAVRVDGAALPAVRGDAVVTRLGLEGGPVYAVSAALRDMVVRDGTATLLVDLQPDLSVDRLTDRLRRRRPKDSWSSTLKRTVGLSPAAVAFVREVVPSLPGDAVELATVLKAVPVIVTAVAPIDRAISSAGGVVFSEVDDAFMLRRRPGTFVVGEMLDWEAPTGGYLLQGTFSTAVAAARGALRWRQER
ncbi:MAG: TIGR03862 family flavoprotein [Actinobacteria bacterium]|nr:TIGR03862 family flavoprotein [Actinomycetota bacterium]